MSFSLLEGLLGAAFVVGMAIWLLPDRRTASKSPARHLGTPAEVGKHRPMTKKEKLDAGALRAAEWARKRKEKKAS